MLTHLGPGTEAAYGTEDTDTARTETRDRAEVAVLHAREDP